MLAWQGVTLVLGGRERVLNIAGHHSQEVCITLVGFFVFLVFAVAGGV